MSPSELLLQEMRDATAEVVVRVRAGDARPSDLADLAGQRADLLETFRGLEPPGPRRARALASEMAAMDRFLLAWCERTRGQVARQILARPRRQLAATNSPRIISQSA